MGGLANRFRILLAALRWRAGVSSATLVVAVAAIASATGSPLYLNAAEDSALRTALAATPVPDLGLTLTANLDVFGQGPLSPTQRLDDAVSRSRADGLDRWFGSGVQTTQIAGSLPGDANEAKGYVAQLVARDHACQHLSFSAGSCPVGAGQVAISNRSALQLHVGLGSPLVFQLAGQPAAHLTLVGTYQPQDASGAYWWGVPFFNYAPSVFTLSGETPFFLDALFVTAETAGALSLPQTAPTVTEEIPLVPGRVGQSQIQALLSALAHYSAVIADRDNVTISTHVMAFLNRALAEQQSMAAIAGVCGAQLVLLALLVLYGIVARSSEGRESEVALAKLHGYRLTGVLTVGLLEPLALITIALPLGVLAAWLGVHGLVGRLFTAQTSVSFETLTILSAAAAYAAAVAAVAVGARELVARPLAEQLRASRKPQSGKWTAALDLAVVVLALAGLLELLGGGVLRGGQADPLALIAPGLLAVAAAITAIRLMPWLCRLCLAPTVGSRFVGTFLALRHSYRRPSTLRNMLVLAIGCALTSFCLIGWTVADQNRTSVAAFQNGADSVLTVSTPSGTDLQDLVRQADPGGRHAMAALFYATNSGTLLAVDSSRLAAVAAWPKGLAPVDVSSIARWLAQASPSALLLRGTAVRLSIAGAEQGLGTVGLKLSVGDASGGGATVLDLGSMATGPHDYAASLPPTCASGCRLEAITPTWALPRIPGTPGPAYYQQSSTVVLDLSSIQTADGLTGPWRAIDAAWSDPSRWAPSIGATVRGRN